MQKPCNRPCRLAGVALPVLTGKPAEQMLPKVSKEEFSCPYCRSLYLVTKEEIPGVDENNFMCSSCGKQIRKWRGTYILTFTLIAGPNR
jgi:DNA-directed RNA polymerase subunit RPC12/RpoP